MAHKTHYPGLGFEQHGPQLWRIIDRSTGSAVGPLYANKGELLADLDRFANGFDGDLARTYSVAWRK